MSRLRRSRVFGSVQAVVASQAYAVERLIVDHPHGVIDLGAAHTYYEDPKLFAVVQRALVRFDNVVLLLPL